MTYSPHYSPANHVAFVHQANTRRRERLQRLVILACAVFLAISARVLLG